MVDAPDRPLPGRQREARSNDLAVLAAAREVFSAQGPGASMADVAHHAGVGVASIYRRYPTKTALVEALHVHAVRESAALVAEVVAEFEAAAGAPPQGPDPDASSAEPGEVDAGAVAAFLARQIAGATGPLLRPAGNPGVLAPELAAASEDLRVGLVRLIAHDRARRLVPEGFTPADVMQLQQHLRPALPFPKARTDALHLRYLALVTRGLREQARAGVVLTDGPDWDEWLGAWQR